MKRVYVIFRYKQFYQLINIQKMINNRKDFTDLNQNTTMGYHSRHGHLIVVDIIRMVTYNLRLQKLFSSQ